MDGTNGTGATGTSNNKPHEPEDDDNRFDWSNREHTIVPEQPESAVYWNPQGQLVIRQRRDGYRYDDDDDQFVFFSVEHLPRLIHELQTKLREAQQTNNSSPE